MEAIVVPRKVWTREQAHTLVALGFPDAEHLELIEGELIDRTGKKRLHVIWQQKVQRRLIDIFGFDRVESESPTDVAKEDSEHNEPEPDLKVLRKASREYLATPAPEEVLLIVEISDTTLDWDLTVKAGLYARAAIVEYWVVNVEASVLVVHREPVNGVYTDVVSFESHEEVSPLAALDASFCLDRL